MKISILTLFADMFTAALGQSIIGRAQSKGLLKLECINIRDFSTDAYKSVDDHPYGGGHGMVLRVDIMDNALQSILAKEPAVRAKQRVILMDPQGVPYTQQKAQHLAVTYDHLVLICGHYEGYDERIRALVDEEVSIGDYVLTGGEIPAMVVVDSVCRLVPGVLARESASKEESFSQAPAALEHPHYTRPVNYKGMQVPDVLLSGNHKNIQIWRKEEALKRTKLRRPDLLPPSTD
jgi:tRNA (guanine37-N1)-methyltransferase